MESITKQLEEMTEAEEKKEFKSGNLFKCILGLNDIESKVFSYLLKNDNVSTMELTDLFEKDRSAIQRALKSLRKLNLVERNAMSLKDFSEKASEEDSNKRGANKRGYLYVYSAKELTVVKSRFRDLLDKWYNSMIQYIENLDQLFDCYESDGELC
jgi:predicted transcriptional regulator